MAQISRQALPTKLAHRQGQGLYIFSLVIILKSRCGTCTKVHHEDYILSNQLFPVSPNSLSCTFFSPLFNSFDLLFTVYNTHMDSNAYTLRDDIERGPRLFAIDLLTSNPPPLSPTMQRKSPLCIPFLGIARSESQFPPSYVCE